MTGVGIYRTEEGGLFDAAAGLYYPDANDKAVYHEAHFDGEILRFKKAQPSHLIKQQYWKKKSVRTLRENKFGIKSIIDQWPRVYIKDFKFNSLLLLLLFFNGGRAILETLEN